MDFPNLSDATLIGYDCETKDPYLIEDGPGWARGVGHVLGVSISVKGWKNYIPLGESPDTNSVRWLKDTLETAIPKTGANLQYDYGWLTELDIWPKGMQYDIQYAEALLDDVLINDNGSRRSLSLDALAMHYLGKKKNTSKVQAYCQERWPRSRDFRENLWKCPNEIVAPYAIEDAELPRQILVQQWQALQREKLWDLFELECKLIPILVRMRRRGIRINEAAAHQASEELAIAERIMRKMLSKEAGFSINPKSGKDLAVLFDKARIPYERTAKGNPSFTAGWLNACDAPIAKQIVDVRKISVARTTFIENAILGKHINGIIYPSLHPLRGDEYGTISGRFSSSQPNSQQIPKRDAEWAPLIRGMFIPEDDGYTDWAAMDLSQIEYRLFAHFANDPKLIAAYADPNCDFHAAVGEILGGHLPRIAMKTINFGLLYGMGKGKLTKQLESFFPEEANPTQKAEEVYSTYMSKFPAAKKLLSTYADRAAKFNEIQTILGRKARFKLYEENKGGKPGGKPYPWHIAQAKYQGNIKVAGTYKAINRALQGSAADLLKKGMVDAYEAGIFDAIGYPHVSVHDELGLSYHRDLHRGFEDLRLCIEEAIPLKVPVKMGLELGPDWGHVS